MMYQTMMIYTRNLLLNLKLNVQLVNQKQLFVNHFHYIQIQELKRKLFIIQIQEYHQHSQVDHHQVYHMMIACQDYVRI